MNKIILTLIVITLSSCARLNSIYRHDPFGQNGTIVSVDAKQRFAISKGGIYCAEPSPDAFSVYSAALEASADKPESLEATLKLATAENGSTLGTRTEVIQLMRDSMYRLCEAYYSGALNSIGYVKQMGRYQKSMVTLLAINQLTNASKPPSVILNSSSSYNSGSNLLEIKTKYDEAKKKSNDLETKMNLKQEEYNNIYKTKKEYNDTCIGDKKPTENNIENCNKYTLAEKEYSKLKIEFNLANQNTSQWENVLEGEKSKVNLTSKNSNFITPVSTTPLKMNKDELKVVAKTVKELVQAVYLDDFNQARCFKILLDRADLIDRKKTMESLIENKKKYEKDYNSFNKVIIRTGGRGRPSTLFQNIIFIDITFKNLINIDASMLYVSKKQINDTQKSKYTELKGYIKKLEDIGVSVRNIDKELNNVKAEITDLEKSEVYAICKSR